jgi:hypothetical protein
VRWKASPLLRRALKEKPAVRLLPFMITGGIGRFLIR